jgi:hypothetical protein
MTAVEDPGTTMPPGLAQRLDDAAAAIRRAPAGKPAVVRLAQAWNGFYTARLVTVLLSTDAVPHRDAYDLAEDWCTQALEAIYDMVGQELVRRYSPDHVAGEPLVRQLAADGQAELGSASDTDVDRIATAMVTLAAALEELLTGVAGDDAALPGLRDTARAAAEAARLIWSHYGGD